MKQQRTSATSTSYRKPFRARTRFLVAAISGCFVSGAIADPATFTVVNGTAVASQAGNVLTITNSAGAILNWNKFGVAAGNTTHFQQTSSASAVLNRVLAGAPMTEIYGTLSSNGRVWLINPSGILVGASGRVDTAGFVASTLGVTNSDFLAGRLNFGSSDGNTVGIGSVVNQGAITTSSGGSVYLVAPNVSNQGIITTPQGETILAAGQTVQLIDTATPGVKVEITGAEGNVTNLGDIVADAGRIGIAGVMVRNSGNLNASSVVSEGGRVFLKASQDAYVDGAGRIVTTGTKGGSVEVLGSRVAVMDSASIDASGSGAGGSIKIGGDYQGKNPDVQNSTATYLGPDVVLKADAGPVGAGGTVIVWSDGTTQAHGSISAQGGASGGNGGLVETSGHVLETNGIRVNAGAANGSAGTWLLDPNDIVINHVGANTQITGSTPFQPNQLDASASSLSDSTINTTLNGGTSVLVTTTSARGGNGDITVNNDVAIGPGAATNKPKFALKADRNISVAYGAQISGSTGHALNVEMTAGVSNASGSINLDGQIKSFGGDVVLKAASNLTVGNSAATSSANATGINARADGIGPGNSVTTADIGIGGHIRLTAGGMVTISPFGGAQTSNTGTVIGGDAGGVAIGIVAGDLDILSNAALRTTYANGGAGFGGGDIVITSASGGPIRLGNYSTTGGFLTLDNSELSQFRVSAPSACGVANGCRIWIGSNDLGMDGATGVVIPATTGNIFVNNANFGTASSVDAQRNVVLSTKSGNIVDQSTSGYGVRSYGLILQGEGAAYGDATAGAPFKFSGNEIGVATYGGANISHVSSGTLVLNVLGAPGSVNGWYPADVKVVSQSGNILLVPLAAFVEFPADAGIYYVGNNLTLQAPSGDITLGGAGILYPVTSSVGSDYSISSTASARVLGYSTSSPHQDGGPAPGYSGATSINIAAHNDVKLDPGSVINAKTVDLQADRDIITQAARIGGLDSNSLSVNLAAAHDVTISSSAFETYGGAMMINAGHDFTLTATTGNGAILSTAGCSIPGSVDCRTGPYVEGGLQTITANNGTVKLEASPGGGFGVALFSGGGQNISAGNIEIRGGLQGAGNDAWITNRSSTVGQTISAHTILLQAGGANSTNPTDRDNDAGIFSRTSRQTVNITGTGGSLTLNSGGGGHNNAAGIQHGTSSQTNTGGQVINVYGGGTVSLNGGNADGGYQNFAEISSYSDQTINMFGGGSVTLTGGAGNGYGLDSFFNQVTSQFESIPNTEKSSNFARIALNNVYGGSPHTQVINFSSGGALSLFGGSRGSNNYAEVFSAYGQTITGNPDVFLRGGASGGAARIAESVSNVQGHERSNHAGIFGGDDDNAGVTFSSFDLHSLTMEGGGNAASYGGAGLEGFNLTVNVQQDVTMMGGSSNTVDPRDTVPNATSASHLTVSDSNSGSHTLTLNVGRDLRITGGVGSSGLAFVGSGSNAMMNLNIVRDLKLEAEQVLTAEQVVASKVGIGSLFGQATGKVLVGHTATVSAKNGGSAAIGSNLGSVIGIPTYPSGVTAPNPLPPLAGAGDIVIRNGLIIDATGSTGSLVDLHADGKIVLTGARVGGSTAYGLGINLSAVGDVTITNSALETNGAAMNIMSGNNFTLTSTTGNGSIVSTAGCSAPNSVDCRTTPYAAVGGMQTVSVAGTLKVEANAYGGMGVALYSGGGQQINANRVEVLGGVSGPNNDAFITNRSSNNQEITAHTIVLKAGGTANTDENNDAVIYSSAGAQLISVTGPVGNLGSLSIYGGAAGHGNTAGIYSTSGAQNIDVQGNLLLQGGGNAASYQNYARIENNASQTINVYYGGSVVLRGGAGGGVAGPTSTSDNFASIKTSAGNQTINFQDSGGRLDLFGGSVGNSNIARVWNSGEGVQTITGNPDITMTGGDSGGAGAFNGDASTDPFFSGKFAPVRGNNAMIAAGKAFDNVGTFAVDPVTHLPTSTPIGDGIPDTANWVKGTQSIDAASITINGSSRNVVATGLGGAGLFSAYGQTVHVVGALRLMGGNATDTINQSATSRARFWSMGGKQEITAKQLHVTGAASGTSNIATIGSWGDQIPGQTPTATQLITLSATGVEGPALWLQTNGSGSTNVLNNSLDGTQKIRFTGDQAILRVEGSFAALGTNGNTANTAHPDQLITFDHGGSIEVIGVGRPIQALDFNQIPRAIISSAGDQDIIGATSITVTAANTPNGRAFIAAQGNQHIETNQLSLTGGGGSAYDSYAAIEHGIKDDSTNTVFGTDHQTIVLTGSNASVTLQGGSGNGVNATSQESGNYARIKSLLGNQSISFAQSDGKISIYGGSVGSSNKAGISSNYGQTISDNPNVWLQGGVSGGAANVVNMYGGSEPSNNAAIIGGDDEHTDHSVSSLSFASLTIKGGTGTGTFSKAGVGGDDLYLTVHGNVTLTGGQSTQIDPNDDVPNAATGAFIYHEDKGLINMTVDGNLALNGGTGSSGIALIGSGGPAHVTLTVGRDLTATAGAGAVTIGSMAGQYDPVAFSKAVAYGGGTSVAVAANNITLNGGLAGSGTLIVGSGNNRILFNGDRGNHPPMDIGTGPVDVQLVAARELTINGQTTGVVIGTKTLGTPASSVPVFALDGNGNPTTTQTYFPPPNPRSHLLLAAGSFFAGEGGGGITASTYGGGISTSGKVTIRTDIISTDNLSRAETQLTALSSSTNTLGDISLGSGTLVDGDYIHAHSAGNFTLTGHVVATEEFAVRAGWSGHGQSGEQSARGGNIQINQDGADPSINAIIGIGLTAFAGSLDATKGNINIAGALLTPVINQNGGVGGVGIYADRDVNLSSSITNNGIERTVHIQAGFAENMVHGGNVNITGTGVINAYYGSSLHMGAVSAGTPTTGNINFNSGSHVYASGDAVLTADSSATFNSFVEAGKLFRVNAGSNIGGNILLGANSSIAGADVDLRTNRPTGAATFTNGNISQVTGGQIDVKSITGLQVRAAGNVDLLGTNNAPNTGVQIYAGYDNSCVDCATTQVFRDKQIAVSTLNAQNSQVLFNSTGPITATIAGASAIAASIQNSSTGGISLTTNGATPSQVNLRDFSSANSSVSLTRVGGDLEVTSGLRLEAGNSGKVAFAAQGGNLLWNANNVYGGSLSLSATGAITQSSLINVSSLTTASGGGTELTQGNLVGTFSGSNSTSGNLNFKSANAGGLVLAGSGTTAAQNLGTSGAVSITSTGTANGQLTVAGNVTSRRNISLSSAGALVQNSGTLVANNTNAGDDYDINLTGAAVTLQNVQSAHQLNVNSAGAISVPGLASATGLSAVGNMVLNAGGAITAAAKLGAAGLSSTSVGGANYTGANEIKTINALSNTGSGNVVFNNTAAPLSIAQSSNSVGNLEFNNTGGIAVTGAMSANGVRLNATGGISQTAPITASTLSTNSYGGTELGLDNLVATYSANNSGSGNLVFKSAKAGGLTLAGTTSVAVQNTASTGDVAVTSVGSGPLTVSGGVSSLRNISLTSTGAIAATANLTAVGLNSVSAGGAAFTGANKINTILGLTNSGSGNVVFNNTAAPLTIAQLNNSAGNVVVDNTGGIVITGAMNASGTVAVTAHSPITVMSTGTVTAGSDITLTASAATPTSAGDALVVSGALSSTGGTIELVGGSVILNATSQINATNGGSVEVAAIGAQGDIFQHGGTIAASTDVSLIADRNVTLNGKINAGGEVGLLAGLNSVGTTGGNIAVNAASNVVAGDIFMIANRDTGTGSFTTGNVSQQAGSTMQTGHDFLVNASGNIDMLGTVMGNLAGSTNLLAGFNNTNNTAQAFTGARVTANNLQANGGSVSIQATGAINAVVQAAGVVGANINNSAAGGLNLTSYGASALVLVDNSVSGSAVNLNYRNAPLTLAANSALVTGNGAGKVNVTAYGGNLTYSGANVSANGVSFTSTGTISQTAPITTSVLYTTSAGGTTLTADNVVGTYSGVNTSSGNLAFKSVKTGGLILAGSGATAVQNSAPTGDISITSTGAGALSVNGAVTSLRNLSLNSAGAINALANLTAVGLNSVSVGGANYAGANHFANVTSLTNTGSGNVVFNNTATPLTIAKMTNTGGNITVDNFGNVVISGEMTASGSLSVTAHSPVTVTSTGSVTAAGNVSLTASSSSAASTIDLLTIDGPVLSSGGNIVLFGGSGIVVTKAVTSNEGNVNATSPFGDVTQTPDKLITAPKGKVEISAFGARPKDPVVIPADVIPDPDPVKDLPKVEIITSLVTTNTPTGGNLGGDSTGGTAGTFGGTPSSEEKKEEEKKKDETGAKAGSEEKPAAQKPVGSCT